MTEREEAAPFYWASVCATAGLDGLQLIEARGGPHEPFGDRLATVRWGGLLLQFVRDRGQELLDVAAADAPPEWFTLEDLRAALGWAAPPAALAARASGELLPLATALEELVDHQAELQDRFSTQQLPTTLARLLAARGARTDASLARLRRRP